MKIAITAQGRDLESGVDQRFGRAQGFIIYNDDTKEFEYIDNTQNHSAAQGAGIQSAKNIINTGAEVLITGNMGPKAFITLKKAGVEIIIGAKGRIKEAVNNFKDGKLDKAEKANVESHW